MFIQGEKDEEIMDDAKEVYKFFDPVAERVVFDGGHVIPRRLGEEEYGVVVRFLRKFYVEKFGSEEGFEVGEVFG